jgi:hypothetical protein
MNLRTGLTFRRCREAFRHASLDFLVNAEVHRAIEMTPVMDLGIGRDEVADAENGHLPQRWLG